MTFSHFLSYTKIRYILTVIVGLAISRTKFRFDKSWRHADGGWKGLFYTFCCTFAANYIADDPIRQIKHWPKYL